MSSREIDTSLFEVYKEFFRGTSTRRLLEQYLDTCHEQRMMRKGHWINDWWLLSLYSGWERPPTIPNREGYKKTLLGMKASPMIPAWHTCHSAITNAMGHSLGHRGDFIDLTIKTFPLSSNFLSTKKANLVDLYDILFGKVSYTLANLHFCIVHIFVSR